MILARSIIFTALMFLSVPVYAGMVVIMAAKGAAYVYRYAVGWARFNLWSLKTLCGLDYTVEGLENAPPVNCILYWKHQSVFEVMASAVLFPRQTWVAKRELLWLPFFGWGFALLKPIAIDRGAGRTAVKQVIAQGAERLAEGMCVVIFPEGTRMMPGHTRRYGISGAALADRTGYPILPIAHNAGDFWPRRGWLKRPGTIRVVVGPPIDPAGLQPAEINDAAQTWIESTMAQISPAYRTRAEKPRKRA
jgi:1-acyl-sn-glycerol-3-phosphate acyltransferase